MINMNLNELVLKWAEEKGILAEKRILPKLEKLAEETNELLNELIPYQDKNGNEVRVVSAQMERGDMEVCLIILDEIMGWNRDECLQMAYDKIKNRRGKMINGLFVKEEDLHKYEENN